MGRDATIHVCNLIFTTCNLATTIEVLLKQYGKKDFLTQGMEKPSQVIIIITPKGETQWLVQ